LETLIPNCHLIRYTRSCSHRSHRRTVGFQLSSTPWCFIPASLADSKFSRLPSLSRISPRLLQVHLPARAAHAAKSCQAAALQWGTAQSGIVEGEGAPDKCRRASSRRRSKETDVRQALLRPDLEHVLRLVSVVLSRAQTSRMKLFPVPGYPCYAGKPWRPK
jgi:hypothetical protein